MRTSSRFLFSFRILYADIVNSMQLASALNPAALLETLDQLYAKFDERAEKNNCLRIKLLGDCYYCVSGERLGERAFYISVRIVFSAFTYSVNPSATDVQCFQIRFTLSFARKL